MRWFNTRLRTRESTISESARVLDQLKGAKAAALHYGEQSKRLEAERDAARLDRAAAEHEVQELKTENCKLRKAIERQDGVIGGLKADLDIKSRALTAALDTLDGIAAYFPAAVVANGTGS